MRRIAKIIEPQMFSCRIEKQELERFRGAIGSQPYLSVQDFVNYAIELFNNDVIQIRKKDFVINEDMLRRFQP